MAFNIFFTRQYNIPRRVKWVSVIKKLFKKKCFESIEVFFMSAIIQVAETLGIDESQVQNFEIISDLLCFKASYINPVLRCISE